ncbi:MAG: hypothetical protein WC280_02575 [Patescibacteria group bacterium]
MIKFLKKKIRTWNKHKVTGWPYFITMMFFVVFLTQMIILIILLKQ